jgi:hypothetical protein
VQSQKHPSKYVGGQSINAAKQVLPLLLAPAYKIKIFFKSRNSIRQVGDGVHTTEGQQGCQEAQQTAAARRMNLVVEMHGEVEEPLQLSMVSKRERT